jgi:hypothetical protein
MTQLSLGWHVFRRPLFWGTLAWFGTMIMFGISMAVLFSVPDKWDRAVAIKICGDLPIVRREDGTIWLLRRWRQYRVEDLEKLC